MCRAPSFLRPRAGPTSLSNGLVPGIAFDRDTDEWAYVWPTSQVGNPIYGRRMTYFATSSTLVGSACGPGRMSTFGGLPRSGSFGYGFRLTKAPPGQAGALWISAGSGSLVLDFLGAPGCFVLIDPAVMIASVSAATNASGQAELPFVLPSGAVLNWVAQWVYLNPGANAIGLQTTSGVLLSVH